MGSRNKDIDPHQPVVGTKTHKKKQWIVRSRPRDCRVNDLHILPGQHIMALITGIREVSGSNAGSLRCVLFAPPCIAALAGLLVSLGSLLVAESGTGTLSSWLPQR